MASETLILQFDGDNLEPDTLEVVPALAFVSAFLELVDAIAKSESSAGARIVGLRVKDKCVQFVTDTEEPDLVRRFAQRAIGLSEGAVRPDRGVARLLDRILEWNQKLPSGYHCSVQVPGGEFKRFMPARYRSEGEAWETVAMRVRLMRAGGKEPRVRLQSDTDGEFSADASEAQIRRLRVYDDYDAELLLTRKADGAVEQAELLEIHPLAEGEPGELLRRWYRDAVGDDWDDAEDLEKAVRPEGTDA